MDKEDGLLMENSFGVGGYQRKRTAGDTMHRSRNSSGGTDDGLQTQETKRSRKVLKRKQEQRVVNLLQMDDFRFYKPGPRGTRESGTQWGEDTRKTRKEASAPVFNASAEDFEEASARILLTKLRKEEMDN